MQRFCTECGRALPGNVKFCPECGAKTPFIEEKNGESKENAFTPPQPQPVTYEQPRFAGNGEIRLGIPAPGFSDRVNHPEILAAVKKNRRAAKIFAFFLVPIPFLGFVIYSSVSGNMETKDAMLYGGIVSAVFLLFALYGLIKERASNTYEATVLDKNSRITYRHANNDSSREMVTEYTTVVRTTDGKKKKIVEQEGSQIWAYNYLNVGDRFKYHPQFHFPYELYDKSKAPYIVCVSCARQNPVESDRCQKCKLPLLK